MTATPKQVADVQEVLGCVRESWPEGSSDAWCSEHWVEDGTPQGKSVEWTDRGCPVAVAAADAATNDHGQPPADTEQAALVARVAELEAEAAQGRRVVRVVTTIKDRYIARAEAAEARVTELEATLTRVRALADAFADDGIARYGGNIAWHIEEAIANEKGDFPDAADQRIASQRDRADAAEATLAKVAALADEWCDKARSGRLSGSGLLVAAVAACGGDLRDALVAVGRPSDGPAARPMGVSESVWHEWHGDGRPSDGEGATSEAVHCGLGKCAAMAGHEGTCAEASGWDEEWTAEDATSEAGTLPPGWEERSAERAKAQARFASPVVAPSATDEDGA